MRKLAPLLVLFASVTSPAVAQKDVYIHGPGSTSCGKFVQDYESFRASSGRDPYSHPEVFLQANTWIEGYLDGFNGPDTPVMKNWDQEGMQVWVVNWCRAKPLEPIVNAATALGLELRKK